jgi:YVTN family beta-propeller protein
MKYLAAFLFVALVSCGAPETPKAYVTSQKGGISVIDIESKQVINDIDIQSSGPRGIGISQDGKYLITANKGDANLSIIDRASGKLVSHVEVGKNPEFIRVFGDLVFVSTEPASSGKPPAQNDHAAKDDDDDDDDDKTPAQIAVVDIKSGKKLREIEGGPETEGIEFNKDGTQIIVTNEADNTVTIHDLQSGELLKTFDVKPYGDRPRGIKMSPKGNIFVSTLEHSDNFVVLDQEYNHLQTVDTGKNPYGVAFDATGDRLFVASSKSKLLEVFETEGFTKLKDIPLEGKRCWHFTFTPNNDELLLACGRSDELIVVDTNSLEVTGSIPVSGIPWGVVTYPKSIGSLDDVR